MPTKKITIKTLEKLAFVYEEAHLKEKKYTAEKNICKLQIDKILKALKTDIVDVDKKAKKFLRVQRVHKRSIIYNNIQLRQVIKSKREWREALKIAFKISINNQGIEQLYSDGILEYEELQSCIDEIKENDSISVLRIKKNLKKK